MCDKVFDFFAFKEICGSSWEQMREVGSEFSEHLSEFLIIIILLRSRMS